MCPEKMRTLCFSQVGCPQTPIPGAHQLLLTPAHQEAPSAWKYSFSQHPTAISFHFGDSHALVL